MKAIAFTHSLPVSDPNALIDLTLPDPAPRGHDLLVEIKAVSVNPVDVKVRRAADPVGEPFVLGWDAAGIVRATGPEASLFRAGDHVFYAGSFIRPGTNAELHLVDERLVGRKPKTLSFAEAAALPLTALTAWEAMFERMQVPQGTTARDAAILIVGGAGGVGSIAIQLARRLTGLRVIATASRPATQDWCRQLGAHDVINHTGDVPAQMKALGVPQVPYVFSTNTTQHNWNAIANVIAPFGHIGLIEASAHIDPRDVMRKSVSIHWEWMFTASVNNSPDIITQHRILNEVSRLVDAGTLRTTMNASMGRITAENLRRAHEAIEAGTVKGKIVLEGF